MDSSNAFFCLFRQNQIFFSVAVDSSKWIIWYLNIEHLSLSEILLYLTWSFNLLSIFEVNINMYSFVGACPKCDHLGAWTVPPTDCLCTACSSSSFYRIHVSLHNIHVSGKPWTAVEAQDKSEGDTLTGPDLSIHVARNGSPTSHLCSLTHSDRP